MQLRLIRNCIMSVPSLRSALCLAGALTLVGAPAALSAEAAEEAPPLDTVIVIGDRRELPNIPGAGATIEAEDLRRLRPLTVNEALRQAPGVFAREEEGMGMRPNIGIRGLNPTRSTKVLLLEDGLPLSFAPYGDNASYYHPPIRRFERIEVLKGASQIRFGPQTIGGVINYVTPEARTEPGGRLTFAAGDNGYMETDASVGGEVLGFATLAHVNTTRSDSARDNQRLRFEDIFFKAERDLSDAHRLSLRLSTFSEDSQITYSGLTEAEFAANPRANPFANDSFTSDRVGASATHGWRVSESLQLKTSIHYAWFDRDWWRQSSSSSQRPNDASDPACGGMANLDTTCGNEGRLREYITWGAESRLTWKGPALGADVSAEAGLRWANERQARLQVNGDTPRARRAGVGRNAGLIEDNLRYAKAIAGFATARLAWGPLSVSPGVRIESIEYDRLNRLTGVRGSASLNEVIPGLGAAYEVNDRWTLFGGVHRGFAPPRVEDIINNSNGGAVDLDAEISTAWEAGLRGQPFYGVRLDVAAFRMDFENQIVPASVAGGLGATLTSAGETRHSGIEASLQASARELGLLNSDDLFVRAALTVVSDAKFVGRRFSNVSGFTNVVVTGNRLPYAPRTLFSGAVGYARGDWFEGQIEVVHTGGMFTDDLNTLAPTANGQRGRIRPATIWNATLNLTAPDGRLGGYLAVKNLFDELTIVDRSRGILPGPQRTFQAGLSYAF
ncbi:MAG: TonB-dependent receptor [Phenylobacterium sp.]|nr:TonB-dependent receptor [Phenylobacterium sp.]MCA6305800.1 TonB-dependent receptor [Phenylobacterium sp.]MCA6314147.1 TonB-dependent receptor [Phenylobacterium sp.]MCA6315955.1 TonB-dependent receptor [Phenylobacterium sp.]